MNFTHSAPDMSKISYEKCICFILLVILVILSCSGFPIDNVAMPYNSKNKLQTTNVSRPNVFLDRVFNLKSTENMSSHKIRHHRQLRAQTRDLRTPKMPMGHIEAIVIPDDDDYVPTTSEQFARIPPLDSFHPLVSIQTVNSRPQRSYNNLRHCHSEHYSAKAYKADIVLHVRAQSIRPSHKKKNHRAPYSVHFKVLKQLKNASIPIHDTLLLQFSNSTENCEKEHRGRKNLVKADIRASQEYILFLNASSANNYLVVAAPEWVNRRRKQNMMKILNRVCNINFKLKPARIAKLEDKSKRKGHKRNRIKLVCKAAGLPIPQISWRRNNVTITNSTNVRIKYVERRSTLVIRHPTKDDFGRYECVARGVNGVTDSKSVEAEVQISSISETRPTPFSETNIRKACIAPYDKEYCLNNGQCFMDEYPKEFYCECPNGYTGKRCLEKTSYQPASMYPQTPLYTCKLGLSTKYYC